MNSIHWQIAGVLPATDSKAGTLGVAGPITGVHNEVLIIAGGANFPDGMPWLGGKKKYHNDLFVMKKTRDSLQHHKTTKLPFPIAYAAACSTPVGVLSAGGETADGLTDKVFLIQWNTRTENIVIQNLPELPFSVANASVALHDDKIYIAGGERKNDVSTEFLVLDMQDTTSGWKRLAPMPFPASHSVMVTQSNGKENCLYLLGGRKRNSGGISDLHASVLQYNFRTKQWTKKEPMPYALSAGTGIATGINHILLFGGDAGETFHKTEQLIAAINKESDEAKKKLLNNEKIQLQSTHPGFCRQTLLYNTKRDKWEALDCIPFNVPVTTTAVRWNGEVLIPSGEIKAGVRTPDILLGKFSK